MQDKVIEYLKTSFNVEPRVDGKSIKFNIDKLDSTGVYFLNGFNMERYHDTVEDFVIKRSGTGLVVIVVLK